MKKSVFSAGITIIIGSVVIGIAVADVQNFSSSLLAAPQAVSPNAPNTTTDAIPPSASYTGSQGNAGDPNSAVVANAATSAPVGNAESNTPADVFAQAAPQPSVAQTNTDSQPPTPAQAENVNENAFGSSTGARTAFARVLRTLMPLDPNQIVTLRSLFDQSQQAVTQYPGVPPKPTSSSILVNMSPGATPPVIRLRQGYVTSLVFLDSTGQPWPIVGYDLGDPRSFNLQPSSPDGKSNMLIIQSLVRYEQGNLAVMLKGQNTPVMLTLIPGQRAVDYRVDLRIPGLGPNALILAEGLPSAESPVLLNFLDGTPPEGAKLLEIKGPPAQGWEYQGHLFLRTRVTVLSPGWVATMSSPDGTHVFEMAITPVILASDRGEMVQLSVKGM